MSAPFYRNPDGTGFAGGLPCQAPSEGGRPRASPEGPAEQGSGSAGDAATALLGAPASRFRVASSCGRHCSACAVATRSAGRGTREAGSTRVGDATTALMDDRAVHPATGSHLPSEATPPFAVAFASSPFAHPIPRSRHRVVEICSAFPGAC